MLTTLAAVLLTATLALEEGAPAAIAEHLAAPILRQGQTRTELESVVFTRTPDLLVPESAEAWRKQTKELREAVLDTAVLNGVPDAWVEGDVNIEWLDSIDRFDGYTIRKLRYEAVPGLWIPALLYQPTEHEGPMPAVMNVNGHVGEEGKAIDYKQIRSINLAKRGVVVLNPEWYRMGELEGKPFGHDRIAYFDVAGVSGLSLFYLSMTRGLDILEGRPDVDASRMAVTGLSGGGWQTIIVSSLDERVALCAPNAGYIGTPARIQYGSDIGDLEQLPTDLLSVADYTHLTAMLAPRPTLLIYNAVDNCCFQAYRAKPSVYDPIRPFYDLLEASDLFNYHVNHDPGTHNYDLDNRQQFYAFITKHFGLAGPDEEIPCDDEVLTRAELDVGLPEGNEDFLTLSTELVAPLPTHPAPARDSRDFERWATETRARLVEALRIDAATPPVKEVQLTDELKEGLDVATYKLRIGDWTLPATSYSVSGATPTEIAVVCADKGRASQSETVAAFLAKGLRVLAVDPVYFGEAAFDEEKNWQLAMFLQSAGDRLLGQQAQQLAAVCDWARLVFGTEKVTLHATGRLASTAALTAAALHPDRVDSLHAPDRPASLKTAVTEDWGYTRNVPLFCFGLLQVADIPELEALAE
jgi:dienelactone hydrolase